MKAADQHAVVPGPTLEERSSEASQMQDRLKSHQSAEGSGRSVPDTAPYASQLRQKREALSALLSSKVAPGTILARLKSCKVSKIFAVNSSPCENILSQGRTDTTTFTFA